jgi:hypothetical protein
VEIFSGMSLVARTRADGRATLDLAGAEGDTFELRVQCPTGFRSPSAPLVVRHLGIGGAKVPEYVVTCTEARHTLVVVVRADAGPNLPLLYLGHEVARTDAFGAAHVAFEVDGHEHLELTLSTAGKENEKLHPQNPVAVFEGSDRDTIEMFEMAFTRDAKKAPPARVKPRGPIGF